MAIKIDKKAVSLIYKYFLRGETDVRQIPYIPQKTRIIDSAAQTRLPRATPEQKGVDSASLVRMLSALERDKRVNIHSVAVLADDSVICEASAEGFDRECCALTHSLCKTVTGIAIGMLADDGLLTLETKLTDALGEKASGASGKMKSLTLYHLLTMSTGTLFNETGAVTSTDWIEDFYDSGLDFEPGKRFAYNSMNSYLLASVVRNVTGMTLSEFLRPRLFDVLGVPDFLWESAPDGTEKGGWGLYVSMETMLKLGTLFINGGMYNGTRIVSEEWINLMKSPQMSVAEETGGYDYGLQMWVGKHNGACLFNGMFGQNILIFPERRIVVTTTASNSEMFQKSRMLDIISDTFTSENTYTTEKMQTKAYKKLLEKQKSFYRGYGWVRPLSRLCGLRALLAKLKGKSTTPLPEICGQIHGQSFVFEPNNSSIMPIFMSFMQNSFGEGLTSITFEVAGNELFITFREGDEVYSVNVGLYGHKRNTLSIRGELYTVMAWAEFTEDEDRIPLLKIELTFPEATSVRRMKLYSDGDGIKLRLSELPGYDMVGEYISSMKVVAPKSDPLVNIIMPRLKGDYLSYKIKSHLEPTLYAKLICENEEML